MPPIKEQAVYGGSQGLHCPRHIFGVSNPNSLPNGPLPPPAQLLYVLAVLVTVQLDHGSSGHLGDPLGLIHRFVYEDRNQRSVGNKADVDGLIG